MKKVVLFFILLSIAIQLNAQTTTKDSAAIKLQKEWVLYSDTLTQKTTVKELVEWFGNNISKNDYDKNFVNEFGKYYNVWLSAKYNEWLLKKPKR